MYDVRPHLCSRKQVQLDHVVNHHASTLLVVDGCAVQLELHKLNGPVPGLDDWRKTSACVLQPLLQLSWGFTLRWGHVMHGTANYRGIFKSDGACKLVQKRLVNNIPTMKVLVCALACMVMNNIHTLRHSGRFYCRPNATSG